MQPPATSASSSTPSPGSHPLELKWQTWSCRYFDAEFAKKGADIVYHFWPHKGEADFPPNFGVDLERGFREVCPPDADVRADYMSKREAAVVLRFGQKVDDPSPPTPTYWVQAVGLAAMPMADRFLCNEVFSRIERAIKERYPDGHQQDGGHGTSPGGSPPRARDHKRDRRRRHQR